MAILKQVYINPNCAVNFFQKSAVYVRAQVQVATAHVQP